MALLAYRFAEIARQVRRIDNGVIDAVRDGGRSFRFMPRHVQRSRTMTTFAANGHATKSRRHITIIRVRFLLGPVAMAKQTRRFDRSLKVIDTRGKVSDADLKAVRDAGYTDANVMEIVALVAMYSLTNFFNNVFDPEQDFPVVAPAGSI